ncbi:MAG: alpha,alpha-trehalase TreF [Ignavibacteriaceae bacterium]
MEYDSSNFIQISGELFNEVQQKRIFPDSKTFVDSVPKYDPKEILNEFLKNKSSSGFDLLEFIKAKFTLPEDDEQSLVLPDDRDMQTHINLIWNYLKRESSSAQSEFSTLIPLPHPFIIPGGRFREVYYWDSYFTMHGLLDETHIGIAENMINNFKYLIDEIGFIPNANRIYYLSRSQPPFFTAMVDLVSKYKKDERWGITYLEAIRKEYNFWMDDNDSITNEALRKIEIEKDTYLNRYYDSNPIPREESYFEDFSLTTNLDESKKVNLHRNIRAACESGWDFSSRWFKDEKSLTTCIATKMLPVDLNSLLYFMESKLAQLYALSGNLEVQKEFEKRFEKRKFAINKYLWDDENSFYFDYNFKEKKLSNIFALAACYPLYFNIAENKMAAGVADNIEKLFLRDGGLISTTNNTKQQWDAPNGWAPLQWMAIKGLRNYGFDELADEIKSRWLSLNEDVFNRTGKMFEKYNVEDLSLHGGGGEYDLQDGFGWTNGVAAALKQNLDLKLF